MQEKTSKILPTSNQTEARNERNSVPQQIRGYGLEFIPSSIMKNFIAFTPICRAGITSFISQGTALVTTATPVYPGENHAYGVMDKDAP